MKRTPLVSVIVSAPAAEEEVAALRAALREQTTPDWELLSAAEGDPGEIRLRLLGEATGRFALFMRPGNRFASERALETLALWAEAEGALLCAGGAASADGAAAPRFARDGWVEAEDFPEEAPLAGVLFRREWLMGQRPAFRSLRGGGDGAFLALALACAGRCWVRAEPCVRTAADPQADGPGRSGPERLIDRLAGMAALARFARERRLAWLHSRQYRTLFGPLLAPCLQARAAARRLAATDAGRLGPFLAWLRGAFLRVVPCGSCLKQALPYGLMTRWLRLRYGVDMTVGTAHPLGRLAAFLPYGLVAAWKHADTTLRRGVYQNGFAAPFAPARPLSPCLSPSPLGRRAPSGPAGLFVLPAA